MGTVELNKVENEKEVTTLTEVKIGGKKYFVE